MKMQAIIKNQTLLKIMSIISLLAIFVAVAHLSLETLPNLSKKARLTLYIMETVVITIFTVEYIARVYYAKNRLKYIFSFLGIIDFIAILPIYLVGVDLSSVRAVRIIRVFRILKLLHYISALKRVKRAFIIAKEELIIFFIVLLFLLYFAAVGIYHFEHQAQPNVFSSVFASFWWAVITFTTVGYGDVYPITVGGKCFTILFLIGGLGIAVTPTGLIASAISKAREEESREEAQEEQNRLLKNQK